MLPGQSSRQPNTSPRRPAHFTLGHARPVDSPALPAMLSAVMSTTEADQFRKYQAIALAAGAAEAKLIPAADIVTSEDDDPRFVHLLLLE